MSRFSEYVFVAQNHRTIRDRFDLAVAGGYISVDVDGWILDEGGVDFELCDFIAPGGFPAFLKEEDALACAEMINSTATVEHKQREGVEYWILD